MTLYLVYLVSTQPNSKFHPLLTKIFWIRFWVRDQVFLEPPPLWNFLGAPLMHWYEHFHWYHSLYSIWTLNNFLARKISIENRTCRVEIFEKQIIYSAYFKTTSCKLLLSYRVTEGFKFSLNHNNFFSVTLIFVAFSFILTFFFPPLRCILAIWVALRLLGWTKRTDLSRFIFAWKKKGFAQSNMEKKGFAQSNTEKKVLHKQIWKKCFAQSNNHRGSWRWNEMEGRCESDCGGMRCIRPPSGTRRKPGLKMDRRK